MKKSELKSLIRECLQEAMVEATPAGKEAKQKGLDSMGWGRYGKNGKVTHITDKSGKLVAYNRGEMQKKTGMTYGVGKQAKKMYTQGRFAPDVYKNSRGGFDSADAQEIEPGRLNRVRPRATPDQQRQANKPHDLLKPYDNEFDDRPTAVRRIVDKLQNKIDTVLSHNDLVGKTLPMDKALKIFGLTKQQLSVYDQWAGYDNPLGVDTAKNTVTVYDSEDL
jgi:hypothetical protein